MESSGDRISAECRGLHIDWSFIPPRTPHQGGLWESSIKLLKRLIKNMVGEVELTQDELLTAAKQAGAIVNSRPLSPMSSDPNDLQPLTPGHFLFCAPPATLVDAPIDLDNVNHVKLTHRLKFLSQRLWERFYREYLAILQTRSKWYVKSRNVKVGDLVLIKRDNTEPLKWPMGRVVEVKPDAEGDVRAIKVRTKDGEYDRGITQVAFLPFNE